MQKKLLAFALTSSLLPCLLAAQTSLSLKEAVQRAVESNPEVQARWHNFRAAQSEQDAARGGYRPRVDLSAGVARRYRDSPSSGIYGLSFNQNSATLSLTQMLFDGFATRNEVARLGYTSLVRYFEVLDTAENIALETTRVYIDVLRYRDLEKLAEDNYVRHRQFFDQIQQRTKAGVGRRVDLEQASGRLALSESNLLTEISNLHDVSARFQRLVGLVPTDQLTEADALKADIPPQIRTALQRAYEGNPTLYSAIENIRAAEAEVDTRKARYSPRLDLRANTDTRNKDDLGIGTARSRAIELVMNVNLYKGGSDSAAIKQAAESMNNAKDLRDKACRDVRQTLTIAYNDVQRISEQLRYLDQHQLSIEKAREAYQRQFEIGQRTLLDLLDTENEYFQARRAYTNAQRDLTTAYARTQAGMGTLLAALNVARSDLPTLAELSSNRPNSDMANCGDEAPQMIHIDKDALLLKATPLFKPQTPVETPSSAPTGVNAPTPTINATPSSLPDTAQSEKALEKLVGDWLSAWMSKDLPRYFTFYANDFKPASGKGLDRADWMKNRQRIISNSNNINIKAEGIKVQRKADSAKIDFFQTYQSDSFGDSVDKTLEIGKDEGKWLIKREQTAHQKLNRLNQAHRKNEKVSASVDRKTPEEFEIFLKDWSTAWSSKNLAQYFSFYANDFKPSRRQTREAWEKHRTKIIGSQKSIALQTSNAELLRQEKNSAVLRFEQSYRSGKRTERSLKTLELVQINGKWLIQRESSQAFAR